MRVWPTVALEDIATVGRGRFSPRPRNDPRYYGGDIPFIQTGDVARSNGCLTTFRQTLNHEGLKVSKQFPAKSLAVTIAANIGDVAEIQFDFACPDSLVVIQPHAGIDRIWLRHVIATNKSRLESLATQNAQKNISLDILRPFPIDLPSPAEQKAIGALLGTWEIASNNLTTLLSTLEIRKQGLMQQLLTGRRRLKGFKRKWKTVRLGAVLDRVTRKNTSACLVPLTVSAQRGLVEQSSYFAKQIAAVENDHYLLLKQGEFAYNRSASLGYPFGAIKRLDAFDEGIVSTLCLCFSVADDEKTDSDFLVGLIEAGLLNRELRAIAHEGARSHGLLNVTATDFFNIHVNLPGIDEQRAMAEVFRKTDTEIALRRQQLVHLKTQKRALMQKLLSGDWRLPEKTSTGKSSSRKSLQPNRNGRKQLSNK